MAFSGGGGPGSGALGQVLTLCKNICAWRILKNDLIL